MAVVFHENVSPYELDTPRGRMLCFYVTDYHMTGNLVYHGFLRDSGEPWSFANPEVRLPKCETLRVRQEGEGWRAPQAPAAPAKTMSGAEFDEWVRQCLQEKPPQYTPRLDGAVGYTQRAEGTLLAWQWNSAVSQWKRVPAYDSWLDSRPAASPVEPCTGAGGPGRGYPSAPPPAAPAEGPGGLVNAPPAGPAPAAGGGGREPAPPSRAGLEGDRCVHDGARWIWISSHGWVLDWRLE